MSDEITPPNPENSDIPIVPPSQPLTPSEQAPIPVPPVTPAQDATYPTVPTYTTNTSAPVKKSAGKKWLLVAIAIFSIIVLSGIGVFAFNAFSDPTDGADSPEGVIKNFSNAANDNDLPAMLSSVDPNEVEPLIENLDTFTKFAKEDKQIKNEDKPLEAYKYSFKNLETKTVKYSDDVARVEIVSGQFIIKVDKSKLPKEERQNANNETIDFEESAKDIINTAEDAYDDFDEDDLETKNNFYIAVKRDGEWYASGLYTAAEYGRIFGNAMGEDIERPSFDAKERVGVGSVTGEKAVGTFLDALVSLRTKDIIETTAPDRFSIGYDYKQALIDLQGDNEDNQYLKLAKDAITITDINTTSKANGKNREFNEIKSVSLKIKYSLDVKEGEESMYTGFPYAVDLDGTWDGKCLSYSGEIKNYEQDDVLDFDIDDEAPFKDASGATFEDSYDLYNAQFPITGATGHVFPTSSSTYFDTYHPLPWTDSSGGVVYDAAGNTVLLADGTTEAKNGDNYPWKDAAGIEVYDENGDQTYAEPTYVKSRNNVDEKTCYSRKELKDLPEIGFVTIKENGKYFVSPIDTAWYYIIWAVKNQ